MHTFFASMCICETISIAHIKLKSFFTYELYYKHNLSSTHYKLQLTWSAKILLNNVNACSYENTKRYFIAFDIKRAANASN